MCFHFKQTSDAQKLKNRFKVKQLPLMPLKSSNFNGFQHPNTPVINHINKESIQLYKWGLIPAWAADEKISEFTLNAKIETLHEKPSFKSNIEKRCLILADGFTEWQWLDAKGKRKRKFEITLSNQEPFAFAGLWSEWVNKQTGEIINSYTIVTTAANSLMAEVHNSKKRMPVILTPQNENDWLNGVPHHEFANCDINLNARGEELNEQGSLF